MSLLLALLLLAAPADATRPNLYDLKVPLTDSQGRKVSLDVFRGQPVLISMFYGTCTSACPLLVQKIKTLETKLSPAARAATRVLLVSFDPARDTPPALARLGKEFGVGERWRLAETTPDSVRDLAAVLGIRYRFLEDGTLNHSSVLTLVDRAGAITLRLEGLDAPDDGLVKALEALVR